MYLKDNPTNFAELKNIFRDEYRGSIRVINELNYVRAKYAGKSSKRHFIKDDEILESADHVKFVVSTQWENGKKIILKTLSI